MTLGEKLHDLRKKNGYTQDKLSEMLDVSRQSISKWELDESVPEISKIVKLSEIYGVSTDYLLLETKEEFSSHSYNKKYYISKEEFSSHDYSKKYDIFQSLLKKHGHKIGYIISIYATFILIISQVAVFISNKMLNTFNSFSGGIVHDSEFNIPPSAFGEFHDVTNIVNPVEIVGNLMSVVAVIVIISGIFLSNRLNKNKNK